MLKSDYNAINAYLIQYYALNVEKVCKYYNPNLNRNQGLIKNDQKNHCDFPTSVETFVQNNKNLTKTQ